MNVMSVQTITVREFDRIPRGDLQPRVLRRLQRLDEQHATSTRACVFDWSHVGYVRALNYVGVIQVDGVTIEILPKIDPMPHTGDAPSDIVAPATLARQNLLYMVSLARRVPIEERDLAPLLARRLPVLEALIALFAERLMFELGRGLHHEYIHQRRTLPFVKGKILLADQVRLNRDRPDRLCLAFDEFVCDTLLNRILRAACRQLLAISRTARTQQRLREALLMLSDVADVTITSDDFDALHLDRQTERFDTVLFFAQLVLTGWSPAPQSGSTRSFSLLFPMEQLYEEFIGAFIQRHARALGLSRTDVHVQARGRRKWLLRTAEGGQRFQLIPYIVIDGHSSVPQTIIDTKWKRLSADVENTRNGVSQSDIYQLYAYANRYESRNNVLLYPRVSGVTAKRYRLDGGEPNRELRIEFVDLGVDLRKTPELLIEELRRVIAPRSNAAQSALAMG